MYTVQQPYHEQFPSYHLLSLFRGLFNNT